MVSDIETDLQYYRSLDNTDFNREHFNFSRYGGRYNTFLKGSMWCMHCFYTNMTTNALGFVVPPHITTSVVNKLDPSVFWTM